MLKRLYIDENRPVECGAIYSTGTSTTNISNEVILDTLKIEAEI